MRNKFSSLQELVANNTDVLVFEETKLNDTFPGGCFTLPGYKSPFRKDRDDHRGWIMVFNREDILSRKLDMFNFSIGIEGLCIEINLKSKWLILATYKPPFLSKHDFFNHVGKALDFYGVNTTILLSLATSILRTLKKCCQSFWRKVNFQI